MLKAWRSVMAGWIMVMPFVGVAGVIKLHPEACFAITNGLPVAVVDVSNFGDETFQVISIQALWHGWESNVSLNKMILPGETSGARLLFPVSTAPIDETPAVIRIKYADSGGTPYSSLILACFPAALTTRAEWVSAGFALSPIGQSGRLSLQLLSLQDEPVDAVVRLIVPDEFQCDSSTRRVSLEPDTCKVETFELTNRAAVPGSEYSIYAIVERQVTGVVQQCATVSGAVTVIETKWIGQSYGFWFALSVVLLTCLACLPKKPFASPAWAPLLDGGIMAALSVFIIWHLSPADLIRNTTPVGGDTPAHLYLVSHLKEQLFHHGRIISWAGGWWCGFPMFQYYFVLPYLSAAGLSLIIPINIAFKLVSVAGLVSTPLCAYWAGRIWRLPRPTPVLLALAMVPFLFVHSHTMWGVNTASTLAGMIANSWSFSLMLPALAYGSRDISEGVVRIRTVILFVLVLASHFFTSVVLFMTLAIGPVISVFRGEGRKERAAVFRRGVQVLVAESLLAGMIMGWWIIPLLAKSGYSMDFGTNWALALWKTFPAYSAGMLLFSGVAFVLGARRASSVVWLLAWMLMVSVVLFKVGFAISPVFVNVRLWPFIFYAMMGLSAVGLGLLLERVKLGWIVVVISVFLILCAVMMGETIGGLFGPRLTQSWAKWNFSGLESKPNASVFNKLVYPLKGTPGRLANDLCEENNQIGSSRIFELVPHLTGKPILEGGLVNSALGSMYSYYIQGETSQACAGFPPIVTPATFDFSRATRHLELFNVKHFIARSSAAQQALGAMKEWRFVSREQEWELYELMTHDGRFVFIPPCLPVAVETRRWKECSLAWLYTPQALDQFLLWVDPAQKRDRTDLPVWSEAHLLTALSELSLGKTSRLLPASPSLSMAGTQCISNELVTEGRIRFSTTALGVPHIIKVTWFPNWKVDGAKRIYRISPGFMCVFPDKPDVELYYGTTWSDAVGYIISAVGCCLVAVRVFWYRRRQAWIQ